MSAMTSSSASPSKKNPGAPVSFRFLRFAFLAVASLLATILSAQSPGPILPGPRPADAKPEWKSIVGIYRDDEDPKKKPTYIVLEREGKLLWRDEKGSESEFTPMGDTVFPPTEEGKPTKEGKMVVGHSILRDKAGIAIAF